MEQQFFGFDDNMFESSVRVNFFNIKNGDGIFRLLPPFAQGKLFYQVDLHWGYTDENGKKKALKCTGYTHKSCPICDEHKRLLGQIEILKTQPPGQTSLAELQSQVTELEKRASDIKRKPTYLWNILTQEGAQKVLQLSWNGHEPLHQKVKFFWEKRKINITDVNANYSIWYMRSGQNAKTRYQYEVQENTIMKLTNLQPLADLTKIYKDSTPTELKAIVDAGYVTSGAQGSGQDSFNDMPAGIQQQNLAQQQMGNVPVQPATNQQLNQVITPANTQQNLNAGQTAQQPAFPSNQIVGHGTCNPTNQQLQLSPEKQAMADEEVLKMQNLLKG